MAPRPYSMERRSKQAELTRDRIIGAALELFAERGARATTMTEVARAADVSPATVLNHFPTQDTLIEAVVARLMADIQVPDRSIFTGARSVTARLRVLTESMFAFFERTSRWFDLLGAELTDVPVLAQAEADFWRSLRQLYAEALEGTGDELLAKVAAGLIHPATLRALTGAGLSLEEATAIVAGFLAHQARRGAAKDQQAPGLRA